MNVLNNIIFFIGEYSYFIIIVTTFALLYNKPKLYYYYIFGIIINSILNIILKLIIKEPRPPRLKNSNILQTQPYNGTKIVNFNIYGMPSGHSQFVFFSTLYIWLACKNIKITIFYFTVALITLYQRVKYNMHTFFQVVIGAIIGSVMGCLVFMFFKKKRVGVLNFKPDDNFKMS